MIENLQAKLMAEQRRNLVQEMEIRKEMGDAMLQQLMESEELRRYVILCNWMQICGIIFILFLEVLLFANVPMQNLRGPNKVELGK